MVNALTKKYSESETLELKKSTSELKEAVISIVAIMNKHRFGELYFGIKNDGKVVGQTVTDKTIREISKTISDNIEPKIFPIIKKLIINGKECVHVEFSGCDGPYYAYGRSYVRVGDEDKKLSAQELERLIIKKNKICWEDELSKKTIKDINESTIIRYVQRANDAKRVNFEFSDVKTTLQKLDLIRGSKLINAAEVLFCDDNNLEIQAAVFAGKHKLTFLDIKQLKGNIFTLLESSESYVKEHINWKAEMKGSIREEIPEIPIRALTEAIVNSLCHRDYANPKGNEIAIFKDRVEIYNPGQFPDGYEPKDFFKGMERSILRNPHIANALYLSKNIEKWGSGIKRIHDVCNESDIKVEFKQLKSGFLVTFYRPIRVTEKVTEKVTENQSRILDLLRKNPQMTIKELSEIVGISERKIKENISKLKEKKMLSRIGSAKGGYWEA